MIDPLVIPIVAIILPAFLVPVILGIRSETSASWSTPERMQGPGAGPVPCPGTSGGGAAGDQRGDRGGGAAPPPSSAPGRPAAITAGSATASPAWRRPSSAWRRSSAARSWRRGTMPPTAAARSHDGRRQRQARPSTPDAFDVVGQPRLIRPGHRARRPARGPEAHQRLDRDVEPGRDDRQGVEQRRSGPRSGASARAAGARSRRASIRPSAGQGRQAEVARAIERGSGSSGWSRRRGRSSGAAAGRAADSAPGRARRSASARRNRIRERSGSESRAQIAIIVAASGRCRRGSRPRGGPPRASRSSPRRPRCPAGSDAARPTARTTLSVPSLRRSCPARRHSRTCS